MFVRKGERERERERERGVEGRGGGGERIIPGGSEHMYCMYCITCTVLHHKTVQMSHHYKMTSLIYM